MLEPELRTNDGAATFARHLRTKAAERLRRGDYYCRRLALHLSWVGDFGGWWLIAGEMLARALAFARLARLLDAPSHSTIASGPLGGPLSRPFLSSAARCAPAAFHLSALPIHHLRRGI